MAFVELQREGRALQLDGAAAVATGAAEAAEPAEFVPSYEWQELPDSVQRVPPGLQIELPLDGAPHVDEKIQGWMGDSRGHWEGETLVVETTNFDAKGWISSNASAGRMHAVPQTEGLRVVERFTRTDQDTITWQTTIDDPDVYTAPWTVEVPFRRQPNYVIYEYACHEGNHAIDGVMGGQRAVEKRDAAR